jgi:hypothetical protein
MLQGYGMIFRTSLAIPGGALFGDVANFYTNTRPTARPGETALAIGDLWYNPSTGLQGFWNGTHWLTTYTIDGQNSQAVSLPGSGVVISTAPIRVGTTFLERILVNYRKTTGVLDSANRYDLTFAEARNDGLAGTVLPVSYSINSDGNPNAIQASLAVNTVVTANNSPVIGLRTVATAGGTPGSVRITVIPVYRYIL